MPIRLHQGNAFQQGLSPLSGITLGTLKDDGVLTPPTVAPVLTVDAELGSQTANLSWTASNKTGSAGFGYKIELNIDGGGYSEIGTTTNLVYDDARTSTAGETYTYRVTPLNDAGEGPVSNEASVILPGESEAPVLLGPSGGIVLVDALFTLSWDAIPGADSYLLERSTDGSSYSTLTSTALLEYETSEASVGFRYFRVTPYAGAFAGQTSNVVEITVVSPETSTFLILNSSNRILLNSGNQLILNG